MSNLPPVSVVARAQDAAPAGERIEAAGFEPTAAKAGRRLALLSPRRIALVGSLAIGLAIAWFLWFLFTAKSVRFERAPPTATLAIEGGFAFRVGDTHLLRQGRYRALAGAAGYFDLERDVEVGEAANQTIPLVLRRLPGQVTFDVDPPGARVDVVGHDDAGGTAPLQTRLPAGKQVAHVASPRHQPATIEFDVEGMERTQTVTVGLAPNWGDITIPTVPPGAAVLVDDEPTGVVTPGPVPIIAGERRVAVKLAGHRRWTDILRVVAGEPRTLPEVALEPADGLVSVASTPSGASVTLDRVYMGETPLELTARPGKRHRVRVFKTGHAPAAATLEVSAGQEREIAFTLEALQGELALIVVPEDAELLLNGESRGTAAGGFTLPAVAHEVEIRKDGYASYRKTVTPQPGFTHQLKVRLLTLAEARLAALKQVRATSQGQELVLLAPDRIRMGAPRREPGRRANEVLRNAELTRLFYLARDEVTNAQFRTFAPAHASGSFQGFDLDGGDQPVVRVAWQDAARYCNWLSAQDGLTPFYIERDGDITGFRERALGYRLPTEAEWAWAARSQADVDTPLRFAWGARPPPPERHGNYADRSASHVVGRIVFGYNDNHIVSAPVGTFPPNGKGIRDLGGNAAEWVHDFYEIPAEGDVLNPLGPREGEYHVIRGASWMRGTVTELRLSYRDYGADGRPDVGFRIARYAE